MAAAASIGKVPDHQQPLFDILRQCLGDDRQLWAKATSALECHFGLTRHLANPTEPSKLDIPGLRARLESLGHEITASLMDAINSGIAANPPAAPAQQQEQPNEEAEDKPASHDDIVLEAYRHFLTAVELIEGLPESVDINDYTPKQVAESLRQNACDHLDSEATHLLIKRFMRGQSPNATASTADTIAEKLIDTLGLSENKATVIRSYARINAALRDLVQLDQFDLNGATADRVATAIHEQVREHLAFASAFILSEQLEPHIGHGDDDTEQDADEAEKKPATEQA